jgi:hypothetical protein
LLKNNTLTEFKSEHLLLVWCVKMAWLWSCHELARCVNTSQTSLSWLSAYHDSC